MMRDSIHFRPAQPADADVAAVLLYSAYAHQQVSYPLREGHNRDMLERLRDYYSQDGNRFSYQNMQVATGQEAVVGLVLSFGGQDEPRLNAAVGSWLEREAKDDEWYVDALAVLEEWGRQGIGTHLLRSVEQQARQRLYRKIALHVAPENTPALTLYTHLGYVVTQRAVFYQRPYLGVVKALAS